MRDRIFLHLLFAPVILFGLLALTARAYSAVVTVKKPLPSSSKPTVCSIDANLLPMRPLPRFKRSVQIVNKPKTYCNISPSLSKLPSVDLLVHDSDNDGCR